jgi:hypothetical protein
MTKTNRKSRIRIVIIVTTTIILGNLGSKLFLSNEKANLTNKAKILNNSCPIEIDEFTRLDSILLEDNKTLNNYYTLKKDKIEEIDIELFNEEMKNIVKAALLNDNDEFINSAKQQNLNFIYHYFDSNNTFISSIKIQPNDYNF